MPPRRIGVRAFRTNLTGLLREVGQGASFLVISRGQVVAELRPPLREESARRPGALRGKIVMAPDFDILPDDILAAMEGDGARPSPTAAGAAPSGPS